MIRNYRKVFATVAIVGLAIAPDQLLARAHARISAPAAGRKVMLMDFTRPRAAGIPADPGGLLPEQPIADVARQMASAFTNAFPPPPDWSATTQTPIFTAASLPNPFLTRAIAIVPSMPVPTFNVGGSCAHPEYQPDYSHGRAAEERRRIIFPLVHQAACEQGLPIGLFDSLIMQESRYNHLAISPKGALGLAQLMPGTARQLGTDPYSLIDNLRGGARYLRQQVDRFGRYDLALAAYNSGPGRVARLGRVPAIAETMNYVSTISANWVGGGQTPRLVLATRTPVGRRAQLIFMSYDQRERTN